MLVQTFKTNYPAQLLLIIVIPLILWFAAFIFPPQMPVTAFDMPLYKLFYTLFSSIPFVSTLLAFLLVYLQALAINNIFASQSLCSKATFLPAFIYMLFMSCDYEFMTLCPILIANTFMILALKLIFCAYESKNSLDNIYGATLFISLATFTFAPYCFFLLWVLFCLINYSLYRWRYWVISLLGFLTPLLFLAIYYFLKDSLVQNSIFYAQCFYHLPKLINIAVVPAKIIFYLFCIIYSVCAIYSTLQSSNNNNISFRKRTNVTILYFVCAIFPSIYCIEYEQIIYLFVPALSFFLTNFFFSKRKIIYSNILFSLLLVMIVMFLIMTIIK
jgi:hypothetical protein